MTTNEFSIVEGVIDKALTTEDPEKQMHLGEVKYKNELEDLQYNDDTKVGILPVTGTLVYEDSWWYSTSYQGLLTDAKTMLEGGAKTIVLDVDSGGGFAYGMMETASLLRKMIDEHDAKLIAYNDGLSASAAYGLSSVAHEFISNPDAETGSIGVVVSMTNWSEYYKKNGIKTVYITAGEGKVPYDKDGNFSEDFVEDVQTKVDALYERFVSHVAQYRNLEEASIKKLGAKVYSADASLEAGLIDKIQTREEFFEYLEDVSMKSTSTQDKKSKMPISIFSKKTQSTKETPSMSNDNQIAEAQMAEVRASVEAQYAPKLTELEANLTKAKAEFETQLSQKDAEVEALKASLQAIEDEKKAAKSAARLSQLTEIFGDVKGKELSTKFEALTDTAFSETVALLSGVQTKADQKLEKEEGSEGEPVDAKPKTREEAMAEYLAKKQTNAVQKPF